MFTIFETLFILAVDDEEGNLLESVVKVLEPALAGGVLAELQGDPAARVAFYLSQLEFAATDRKGAADPLLSYAFDVRVDQQVLLAVGDE